MSSAARRIGVQTLALVVDAYRELNARKLFWITLVLSCVMVLVFAAFGINRRGLTFLWWEFPLPLLNSTIFPPDKFYKFIFANFGVPIWLSWAASILALVSTAGIFPEFISGGSIELSLSKPISRLRLFLSKYFLGLSFVFLQVLAFTLACFLVIGLRGQKWDFTLFLAVPIVLCFYSYLFCFCVLMGLLTGSTIASVLLTCLFWIVLFTVNAADAILLQQRVMFELRVEKGQQRIARVERSTAASLRKARERGEAVRDPDEPLPPGVVDELEVVNPILAKYRADLADDRKALDTWYWWHRAVYHAKSTLPKTKDTIGLLDRYLLTPEEKDLFMPKDDTSMGGASEEMLGVPMAEMQRRMEAAVRDRSVAWVLGTSLGFEAVVLGIGALVFIRRDF